MHNVLVVAPHPDDEVLGVGGTILHHLAQGDVVHVVVCTRGEAARFGAEQVDMVQQEARQVHAFLGVTGSHFLDLPAARLDTVPGADLNAALAEVFDKAFVGSMLTAQEKKESSSSGSSGKKEPAST